MCVCVRESVCACVCVCVCVCVSGGYPPSEEEVAYWRTIGGNLTTNVPMLKTPEGKVYCQSSAILRSAHSSRRMRRKAPLMCVCVCV